MISIIEVDRLRELVANEMRLAIKEAPWQDKSRSQDPEWISNRSALELLDVSPATLYRYRRGGLLPYSKVGQKVFYRLSDIRSLLDGSDGGDANV